MSEKIVQLNEEVIKGQIKELVRVQAACAFFSRRGFPKTGNRKYLHSQPLAGGYYLCNICIDWRNLIYESYRHCQTY